MRAHARCRLLLVDADARGSRGGRWRVQRLQARMPAAHWPVRPKLRGVVSPCQVRRTAAWCRAVQCALLPCCTPCPARLRTRVPRHQGRAATPRGDIRAIDGGSPHSAPPCSPREPRAPVSFTLGASLPAPLRHSRQAQHVRSVGRCAQQAGSSARQLSRRAAIRHSRGTRCMLQAPASCSCRPSCWFSS